MERLLHYVWKYKLYASTSLATTEGLPIAVIDPGIQNTDAGPDFFNAKIKIDGTVWAGSVEIHEKASDWLLHHHDSDKAYDSVILHVTGVNDASICRMNGEPIPQLILTCPDYVCRNYHELVETESYPPCYRIIPTLSIFTIHSWMSALQLERFEQKASQLSERLKRCNSNWEDAFFITLARNFGFGLNGDAFETWANRIPLRAVDKHRDELFQIEAFFFGQAGLLQGTAGDEYYLRLKKEYEYLSHKFELTPMDVSQWRFLRLRPTNFPHIRIAQLAVLYHRSYGLLSRIMEAETVTKVHEILKGGTSAYWVNHYTFEHLSPSRPKTLSNSSLDLLIINTVATFLYSYGIHKGKEEYCARAGAFLEELKAEYNYITRMWEQCGIKAANASDSQALIQLKKEYCDKKKCLYCRIGYEYLKRD